MPLLEISLSAVLPILLLLLFRPAIKKFLPKNTLIILWTALFLKLLLSPLNSFWEQSHRFNPKIISLVEISPDSTLPAAESDQIPSSEQSESNYKFPVSEPIFDNNTGKKSENEKNLFFSAIISLGAAITTLYFIVSYFRCLNEFKTSLPLKNEFTENWLKSHKIKRKISIRQSDKITSPLTYGIFRPVILLPKQTFLKDEKSLNFVFLHEYIHIRRFDALLKLICAAALCLHWFNPAVWLMYIFFNRDIELSCDEVTVKKSGINEKTNYALTLIAMEERKSGLTHFYSPFGKNFSQERIISVMKTKKIKIPAAVSGTALILALASVFVLPSPQTFGAEAKPELSRTENTAPLNETYSEYAPYGLAINPEDGKLYYNGSQVRRFDDIISEGFFGTKAVGYYEKNGVTDIKAVRENNKLEGLEIISEDKSANDSENGKKTDFSANQPDMLENLASEYGLEYNKTEKALYFEGNRVRLFWDSLNSESLPTSGNPPFVSTVSNWDSKGVIDVYVNRNYKEKDKNGNGKLLNLRIADTQEFNQNTLLFETLTTPQETP